MIVLHVRRCQQRSTNEGRKSCHYSFIKSNKKMLVVNIQGAIFNPTDPEITTLSGHFDEEKHFLFCAGNFSMEAYTKFFESHKCRAFCSLLGLEEESIE